MTKAASQQGGCFLFLQGGIRTQIRLGAGYANSNSSLKRLEQAVRNLYNNSKITRVFAMQTVHKRLCVRIASDGLKEDFPCRTVIRAILVITASWVYSAASRQPDCGLASTGIGLPMLITTRTGSLRITLMTVPLGTAPLSCGRRRHRFWMPTSGGSNLWKFPKFLTPSFFHDTLDFSEVSSRERTKERSKWHSGALAALNGCALVFVDPINGLMVLSAQRSTPQKCVLPEELFAYYRQGASVVYYQHKACPPDGFYTDPHNKLLRDERIEGSEGRGLKFTRTPLRYTG